MTNRIIALSALISCCLIPALTKAHHSVAAEYDLNNRGTIEGVVSEVWFKNPHVRYYIAVTDKRGKKVIWNMHGHNPVTLVRTGWTPNLVRAGDAVVITGDLSRDGSPKMFIRTVELSNGRILLSSPGADNHAE